MSSLLNTIFFGATDVGKVRTNNEDEFIAQPIWEGRHILLVAIDGMGGEEGGEVAARIAKDTIIKYFDEFRDGDSLSMIKRAVTDANNEIVRYKSVEPRYSRMGCVATAGLIDLDKETLSVAHVGDSRLYRYSNGELSKLTHDHSFVGYQEEQGILTEEQAMKHPRRSIIDRCLGDEVHYVDDASFVEAGVFPLIPGESFLFCSDGLSDVLTTAQIAECLGRGESPQEECSQLINKANDAGGKDNITIVIAQVTKVPESEKKTSTVTKKSKKGKVSKSKKKTSTDTKNSKKDKVSESEKRTSNDTEESKKDTVNAASESHQSNKIVSIKRITLIILLLLSIGIGFGIGYYTALLTNGIKSLPLISAQ